MRYPLILSSKTEIQLTITSKQITIPIYDVKGNNPLLWGKKGLNGRNLNI